jgi:hypothetical protein
MATKPSWDPKYVIAIYQLLDNRHIHDEEILMKTTGNFMLVNSFLLVAFANFHSWIICATGIAINVLTAPMLLMQLKTTALWLSRQNELEKICPTPLMDLLDLNYRHAKMTAKSKWMWPFWRGFPLALALIMAAVWAILWCSSLQGLASNQNL